jgi:hypothetical protein
MRPPGPVRILDAHVEYPSIAVHVLHAQPVFVFLARIWPHAGADQATLLEPPLRSVRVQARNDVEHPRVERARDLLVVPVLRQEPVDEMERGAAAGPFHRVDVRLDQEARFVDMSAGLCVRDGDEQDVASLVGLADRLDGTELRHLLGPRA